MVNGLYMLDLCNVGTLNNCVNVNTVTNKYPIDTSNSKYLWHLRLGHIGEFRINRLEKDGIINPCGLDPFLTCESCILGKMTKLPLVG